MPKFLIEGSYTDDGLRGLLKRGGTARKAGVEQALKPLGGKLESFYFTFGDEDAFIIADLPDNVTAAAVSLATSAAGYVRTKTKVLLTPEEIDAAAKKSASYRPPGK